jgi:hypothetical protein
MAKKTELSNPLLIDKIEQYLRNNYAFILGTIAFLIVVIFSIQLINNIMDRKNKKIYDKIGYYEILINNNNFTEDDIDKMTKLAKKYSSIRDYSYLKSAILYIKLNKIDKALPLLENNKRFDELSKSLIYDLGKSIDFKKYKTNGNLKSLWDYREIISDNKITEAELNSFKEKYKDSQLITLLENWQ